MAASTANVLAKVFGGACDGDDGHTAPADHLHDDTDNWTQMHLHSLDEITERNLAADLDP